MSTSNLKPPEVVAAAHAELDSRFVEHGISVWDMDDGCEYCAGRTFEEALACAIESWSGDIPASAEQLAEWREGADDSACDLDAFKINVADEDGPAEVISYREQIRRLIAAGATFPAFFCGYDG